MRNSLSFYRAGGGSLFCNDRHRVGTCAAAIVNHGLRSAAQWDDSRVDRFRANCDRFDDGFYHRVWRWSGDAHHGIYCNEDRDDSRGTRVCQCSCGEYSNPIDYSFGRKKPRCFSDIGKFSFSNTASISSQSKRFVWFPPPLWSK